MRGSARTFGLSEFTGQGKKSGYRKQQKGAESFRLKGKKELAEVLKGTDTGMQVLEARIKEIYKRAEGNRSRNLRTGSFGKTLDRGKRGELSEETSKIGTKRARRSALFQKVHERIQEKEINRKDLRKYLTSPQRREKP